MVLFHWAARSLPAGRQVHLIEVPFRKELVPASFRRLLLSVTPAQSFIFSKETTRSAELDRVKAAHLPFRQ